MTVFGNKTASQKGFGGALPAFRHCYGKRAVVQYSVREAATRKGLIPADQHRDTNGFDGKTAAQK